MGKQDSLEERQKQLDGLIRFWKATLEGFQFVMATSTITHVGNTIRYLKELREKMQ